MLRFILRILLVIVFFRFVGGLMRALGSGSQAQRLEGKPERKSAKPIVDRSRAIDVPFTEDVQES